MSTYVMHIGRNGGAYGVRETTEDLIVWQAEDASASSAAYLVAFLNAHARGVPAHRARTLLVELGSDLQSIATPPSAILTDEQRARYGSPSRITDADTERSA